MMQDLHVKLNPDFHGKISIQQEKDYFHQQIVLKFKEEISVVLHFQTWHCIVLKLGTLRKVGQKHREGFEIWCCRRMEKISWTDRVRNEKVLHRVEEDRNNLHTIEE
jgi:hypothetical protein